jgi:hypothetical protein
MSIPGVPWGEMTNCTWLQRPCHWANQARQEYDLLIQDHSPTASMKRLDWNEAVRVEEILEELRDEYSESEA